MKYDFDIVTERRGSGCVKWDSNDPDVLPMWVADMDFKVAPCIMDALRKRVEHGIFGYTLVPEEYYRSIDRWFSIRHGWHVERESIIYTSSVVPAISAIIKAMTSPGDKVVIQSPVYNCFFSSIRNNGCELLDSPLVYNDGKYFMDLVALEKAVADPKAKVMLLCNPHNPAGRVWSRDELKEVAEICLRNGVFVISDEIHCELTYPGCDYVPYNTLGKEYSLNSAVCVSPSKAFNIAGLQIANIVAEDPGARARIVRAINDNEVCNVNPFGVEALIAAYENGAEWLDQMREYLYGNYRRVCEVFSEELPDYPVLPLEGTYLVWIDCSRTGLLSDRLAMMLLEKERLRVNPGVMYGDTGNRFLRLNIACPRSVLESGLERLCRFLHTFP